MNVVLTDLQSLREFMDEELLPAAAAFKVSRPKKEGPQGRDE
jgi:hypothetical protein